MLGHDDSPIACANRILCVFLTQQTLLQLGSVQVAIKDYDSALRSFQEALKIRRTFSSRSGVTLMTNSNARQMGNILSRLGLLHFETGEYFVAFEEAIMV